jgi:transcriptional regulator with XRE-family HTH domain
MFLLQFLYNFAINIIHLMEKVKLIKARNAKKYTQEKMAEKLCMDTSGYNRREKGLLKISAEHWQKLSDILKVPLEDIYEADENLIFIFNDNSTGNGNIVTNYTLPQYILDSQRKYIEKLEEELKYLKNENQRMKD